MLSRVLVRKFGPLSAEIQQLIAEKSSSQLEAIADRVFTAATLNEALGTAEIARSARSTAAARGAHHLAATAAGDARRIGGKASAMAAAAMAMPTELR